MSAFELQNDSLGGLWDTPESRAHHFVFTVDTEDGQADKIVYAYVLYAVRSLCILPGTSYRMIPKVRRSGSPYLLGIHCIEATRRNLPVILSFYAYIPRFRSHERFVLAICSQFVALRFI